MTNAHPVVLATFVLSNLVLVASAAYAADSAPPAPAPEQRPGPPPGPHPGPPPEAFEACASKAAGDACTVAFHDQTLTGTCLTPPIDAGDSRLFCLPKDMPPPPPR